MTPGDAARSFGRVHQRLAGAREEREREEIMNYFKEDHVAIEAKK